jgi:hypothetical protein
MKNSALNQSKRRHWTFKGMFQHKFRRKLDKVIGLSGVFLLVALCSGIVVGCLNPMSGEYEIPPIPIQGEITVDNINSSEIQFINHTKSMDIAKVEVTRIYEEPGQSGIKLNLDARLLGGPHAGTRESLLVRPIGANQIQTMTVAGYRIKIYYEKAAHPEQITQDQLDVLDLSSGNMDIIFGADENGVSQTGDWSILPRGKTIVHFYRSQNSGEIEIQISDPASDTDQSDYFDYIQNVTIVDNGGDINLNNIDVSIAALPPVKVEFSPEIQQSIIDLHLSIEGITAALNNLNTTTASIAAVLGTSYQEGRLEIQNYSSAKLTAIGLRSYDGDQLYIIQNINKGPGKYIADVIGLPNPEILNPGKAMSESVVAGNYYVRVVTEDGTMFDIDTTIRSAVSTSGVDNKIYIWEDYVAPAEPELIDWTLTADGGPTQSGTFEDTEWIFFTFTADPGNQISMTQVGTSQATVTGTLERVDGTTFKMAVTPVTVTEEVLSFQAVSNGDVEPGPRGVTVYKYDPQIPVVTTYKYIYKSSGVRNTMPLLRHQTHNLDWYLTYAKETYEDGVKKSSVDVTLEEFGSFIIDGSNDVLGSDKDTDYVRFRQSGSWVNPNNSTRTASLRVGTYKSGTYMDNDTPSRDSGQWEFYTGLNFSTDLSALGINIENMPSAEVPLYIWGYQIGKTTRKNYLPVTFTIQNKAP